MKLGRLLGRQPLYDIKATRACLESNGFSTFESNVERPTLRVEDADGQVTWVAFFESEKASKEHALPPFAHKPAGTGPDVHRNVVVSNLASSTADVVACLRSGES